VAVKEEIAAQKNQMLAQQVWLTAKTFSSNINK
jgi:hypothetical protein